MLARGWHAAVAVLVFAAIALQVVTAVRVSGAPHEVSTGVLRGASLAGRIIRVFSFFTIQSSLLCGITSAQLAARPGRDGPAWRPLRLAALFGITVTGIVYSTVLAAIHQPNGTAETLRGLRAARRGLSISARSRCWCRACPAGAAHRSYALPV